MTPLDATGPVSIFSRSFTDPEEVALAVRDAGVEYVPLHAGRYEARLTGVHAGRMYIQRAADQPHVVRGTVDAGRVGFLFPVRLRDAAIINGHALRDDSALVLAAGCELHGLCPAPIDWASLSLPTHDVERLLDLGGMPALLDQAERMLVVPPAAAASLVRTVAEVTDHARQLAEAGATTLPPAFLAEGLMEACMEAFSRAEEHPLHGRATRDAIRRVGLAEEFLRANVTRPIYTDELCCALAVSPRKLQQAFIAACGMSPHAYLKRRRLMMVRQALKSGGQGASLVKSVALSHGFWHLGNFANDYREQFGQLPSDTLAQARLLGP